MQRGRGEDTVNDFYETPDEHDKRINEENRFIHLIPAIIIYGTILLCMAVGAFRILELLWEMI